MNCIQKRFSCVTATLLFLASSHGLYGQGTAFSYQGKLATNGSPVNGTYDFRFKLFVDAGGGTQFGGPFVTNGIAVANGLFTTQLDFGAGVFTGSNYWLQVGVRTNVGGSGTFVDLSPVQPIAPTPYAIMANSASNLLGVLPTTKLNGTLGNAQLANSSVTVTAGAGLSGGGAVALGGSTTLNNAGVLSVSGPTDITANTVAGVVTLGSDATAAATPSTIVKRDAAGSFTATNVTLNGKLTLPAVSPTINYGAQSLLFQDAQSNLFFGPYAGNTNVSGRANVGIGISALSSNAGGAGNTAVGYFTLSTNSNGNLNSAFGAFALNANTTGSDNTAIGVQALTTNSTGNRNIAVGSQALVANTIGSTNVAVGYGALFSNSIGGFNTAIGYGAAASGTKSSGNTVIGYEALFNNVTGSNNIAIGFLAGTNLTSGSSNIYLGSLLGYGVESNTIRIGTPGIQTDTIIAGKIQGDGGGLTNLNLPTDGHDNLFLGPNAGNHNATGQANTAVGDSSMESITTGLYNVALGLSSLDSLASGNFNVAIGIEAQNNNTTGNFNTALGTDALFENAIGSNNVAIGALALENMNGGSNNIAIGTMAGGNNDGGNNNIYIGHPGAFGVENNIIRIGTPGTQTLAVIAGTITGDGGGLTNLNASKLIGTATLPASVLPSGVAFLNASQTFTGIDTFTNNFGVNTGAGLLQVISDAGASVGLNATGGFNPGHVRFRNALEIFPNQAGTTAGSLDVRNASGAATIALAGSSGTVTANSLNVDPGNLNVATVANAITFGSASGEGIGSRRASSFSDSFGLNFYTSFAPRITILNNGNVGIGTTNADALLSVNGSADKPGGGSWSTFSDARLKDVSEDFTHGLDDLARIQPVLYHYKTDNALKLPSAPEYVGVVAQQVQQAIPEAVEQSKSGYLTVNNDPIIWTMVNAIKELKAENETLKHRLDQLEKEKGISDSHVRKAGRDE